MAITAKLALCGDVSNKVQKDTSVFASARSFSIQAYEEISDTECDFIVSNSTEIDFQMNWMQVAWNGITKYYFVRSRSGMSGNMVRLRCEVDVLTTYKNRILSTPCVIERTSNSAYVNMFVHDAQIYPMALTDVSSENFGPDILGQNPQEYIYVGIWANGKATASGGE